MRLRVRRVLAALSAAGLFSVPATAEATESQSIGIAPVSQTDWLQYRALPGEIIKDEVVVFNRLTTPMTVKIYAVDAVVTPQGGFALRERSEPREDVGSWAKPRVSKLTLDGGESRRVPIVIRVPIDAEPGDHAGGIVVERAPQKGSASNIGDDVSVQFDIIERVGLRTFVNVEGVIHRELVATAPLTWVRDGDAIEVRLPVRNEGNVRLVPQGTVTLGGYGLPAGEYELEGPEVLLPSSEHTMTTRIPADPLIAWGDAQAVVSYGGDEDLRASAQIRIVPIGLVVAVPLGVLVLALLLWRVIRFVRRARAALRGELPTRVFVPEEPVSVPEAASPKAELTTAALSIEAATPWAEPEGATPWMGARAAAPWVQPESPLDSSPDTHPPQDGPEPEEELTGWEYLLEGLPGAESPATDSAAYEDSGDSG